LLLIFVLGISLTSFTQGSQGSLREFATLTADSITAYYLLARDSIDEKVWDLIEKKRRIIAQILDGEEVSESMKKQISFTELIRTLHT
ncbi:MAG: hypothetical protein KR126chlam6_01036, partial [Candidatus Anoxychlamydiales bacterium]|nr:hypothetical protein [Candidatus Anoxychlamydiales bacterium]